MLPLKKTVNSFSNPVEKKKAAKDLKVAVGGNPETIVSGKKNKTRLNYLKRQIWKGHKWLLVWSDSLREIRDDRLFELEGFDDFESFCNSEWGYTPQYANRIIQTGEVIKSLPAKTQLLISNEKQARELGAVPVSQRVEILEEVATEGTVTGRAIAEKINQRKKEKPENAEFEEVKTSTKKTARIIELDETGCEIPDSVLEDWHRADELADSLLKKQSEMKVAIESGINSDDVIFKELNQSDIATIKAPREVIKQIKPYSVCTTCQGHERKKCKLCIGKGFLSKGRYEQCVPAEIKAMREKK